MYVCAYILLYTCKYSACSVSPHPFKDVQVNKLQKGPYSYFQIKLNCQIYLKCSSCKWSVGSDEREFRDEKHCSVYHVTNKAFQAFCITVLISSCWSTLLSKVDIVTDSTIVDVVHKPLKIYLKTLWFPKLYAFFFQTHWEAYYVQLSYYVGCLISLTEENYL